MSLAAMYNQKIQTDNKTSSTSEPKVVPYKLANKPQDVNASPETIEKVRNLFIKTLLETASGFSDLDKNVVRMNVQTFKNGPDSERRIYFNRLAFMFSNAAILEAHLVEIPGFRKFFIDVIKQEIAIDGLPAEEIMKVRNELRVPGYDPDDTYYIYGKQTTTPDAYIGFIKALTDSYTALGDNASELAKSVEKLSKEDRKQLGIAFSHFGYLLRAIARNDKFMVTCVEVVDRYNKAMSAS